LTLRAVSRRRAFSEAVASTKSRSSVPIARVLRIRSAPHRGGLPDPVVGRIVSGP
jgi:hypothetical protein